MSVVNGQEEVRMGMEDRVLAALEAAVDELNGSWPDLRVGKELDTVLVGADARLDSTSFVFLMVAVEQHLERLCGTAVSVMDLVEDRPRERLTIGDLADRVRELLQAGSGAPAAGAALRS